jgi:hypothetical protein
MHGIPRLYGERMRLTNCKINWNATISGSGLRVAETENDDQPHIVAADRQDGIRP